VWKRQRLQLIRRASSKFQTIEFFLVTQSLYLQNNLSSTCCGHAIYLVNENSPLLCNVHSLAEFDELFEGLSRRFGANLSSAKYIFSQVHSDSASIPRFAGAALSDMTKQDRAKTSNLI
jgi:hypothetical protein